AKKPLVPNEVDWKPPLSKLTELADMLQSQAQRTQEAIASRKAPTKIAAIGSQNVSTRESEDSSQ
ncbi:MAG: hypothetical protein AAGG44_18510, partial [Planctomycetota bacterium]